MDNVTALLAAQKGSGSGGGTPHAVLYTAQTLSNEQQAQARSNIGAGEPVTGQQIADAAGAWLDENITNPTDPPIDTSLSVSGAAADSAVIGAVLYGASSEEFDVVNVAPWKLSTSINAAGTESTGTAAKTGAVTSDYYTITPGSTRKFRYTGATEDASGNKFNVYIHEYASDGTWLRRTWLVGVDVTVGIDCSSVRFSFARLSSTGITMTQAHITTFFEVSRLVQDTNGLVQRVEALEAGEASPYEAGKTYYFTVKVNQAFANTTYDTSDVQDAETYSDVQCVVKLPSTYVANGTPTPLIMCAHGTSGWVSNNSYQSQLNRWDDFLADGYATFDVNGGMPFDSENAHTAGQCMGGPRAVEAYFKAFEYIRQKMNVEPLLYVSGMSMGGLAALNFANRYPEIVKCIGLCYPVTALYSQAWLHPWYTGTGAATTKGCIAREYNFTSASTWEAAKVVGFNPETNKHISVNSEDYCLLSAPLKIWHGDADATVDYSYSVALVDAIKRAGGIAEMRVVHGAGHGESTFSEWTELFTAELKAYFNRYRLKT